MELDVLLAGVGGQGVLTIAQAISRVALLRGLEVKQSEVHGMSQRGGAVEAHLRYADHPIHSDLIPSRGADLLLAVEPLEALRYTNYLNTHSVVVSNCVPLVNIPDYPPLENVLEEIARQGDHVFIDARRVAQAAGSVQAENMVMLGASAPFLDFPLDELERLMEVMFGKKGPRIVEVNRRALRIGYRMATLFREGIQRGRTSLSIRQWMAALSAHDLASLAGSDGPRLSFDHSGPTLSADAETTIRELVRHAHKIGRSQLFEHEVYRIVESAGAISPPRHLLVEKGSDLSAEALDTFPGGQVVLKIVSSGIVHKTESGGVSFVAKELETVQEGIDRLIHDHAASADPIEGALVVEFVESTHAGLGGELFVGIRQTREFGPVLAAGLGGVDTEYLAARMRPGVAVAKASAMHTSPEQFFGQFQRTAAYEILSGQARGHRRIVGDGDLIRCFRAFTAIARQLSFLDTDGICIEELEVNPFAFRRQRLVPLDGRGRLGTPIPHCAPRPVENVRRMLEPGSIAIAGVSAKRANFGRIILDNIRECGFPPDRLFVVKEGLETINGIRCVPTIGQLPNKVDLLVAATSADATPLLVEQVLSAEGAGKGCRSVILISGGLGEKQGTENVHENIRSSIQKSRQAKNAAPVFLGANCMGVRSRPGRYDTFFIPETKLDPRREATPKRAALISQSGGFVITRMSNLQFLDPMLTISLGNQVDVTVSDVLLAVAARHDVDCIGVYMEGFSDLDGLAFLRAVEQARSAGKIVVFYKAGRTAAGGLAAKGHTASVAGDYDVCQAAVANAGALVADTFKEFEQLVELATDLQDKRVGGTRIGGISNAGYEAVGMADTVKGARYEVEMPPLTGQTRDRLAAVLTGHKLDGLVDAKNPLDLTPMADEAAYEACIRALLEADELDALLVGCVPMTPKLLTTPEEILKPESLATRIPKLFAESTKPMVFIVDGAGPYDAFAQTIRATGVPVFRSADQAVRSLGRYLNHRQAQHLEYTHDPTDQIENQGTPPAAHADPVDSRGRAHRPVGLQPPRGSSDHRKRHVPA